MDRRETPGTPAVGGSSLLVIFAVLSLTVFALLSLSTVQASSRLSQSSARAAAAYYEADCQAEELLARLRAGELPEGVTQTPGPSQGEERYRYACPISDTQTLAVEVALTRDGWSVLSWQAISTARWQPDDRLPVWDGLS